MHIGYWWKSQKVRDHWEGVDNIKMDLKREDGMVWTG
jgi:hypothetical protein